MNVKKYRNRTLITTGVVAAHCGVSYEAVAKWIRKRKLRAYTTPGGQHRVRIADFQVFLDKYGMPSFDPPSPRRRRILIADDDQSIVFLIQKLFTSTEDYECATAQDGYDAGVQVMKFRPDVVILDLMIPSVNGITLCRKLKTSPDTTHIRVLAITGYPQLVQEALAVGADVCLIKPFNLETLYQTVEALFASAPRGLKPRIGCGVVASSA